MKILTASEILAQTDQRIEPLEIPEWGEGVGVCVRPMTSAERDAWENSNLIDGPDGKTTNNLLNYRARLAALVVCDEAGKPLFTPAHAEELGIRNAAAMERIFILAQRLSHITAEDLETLKKKSAAPPGSASSASSA